MNIEKAIKQTKPFKNSHQKVLVNLLYTSNWLNAKQKAFFKSYGLTPKQYNILRILRGAGKPISTATIRERMLDKMSDASRIVDRLEKKGLVIKQTCGEDQRKVDIILTGSAEKLLKKLDIELGIFIKGYSRLTAKEADQLSDLLDKMRK